MPSRPHTGPAETRVSLQACGDIVRRGDPDRFRAAMAAPPAARPVLFPLYALNVEIARAPFVTSEPMIAEIRLQWWRDALEEIAAGQPPRRHEVVEPLAAILDPDACGLLDPLISARRWEVSREPFASVEQLIGHVEAIAGTLMWVAARALGAGDEGAVRARGLAGGLAGWLASVPALRAAGLSPLPDDSDATIRGLAERGLSALAPVSRAARPAALAAWEAGPVLRAARADPAAVREGRLARPEALRRARLLRQAVLGR